MQRGDRSSFNSLDSNASSLLKISRSLSRLRVSSSHDSPITNDSNLQLTIFENVLFYDVIPKVDSPRWKVFYSRLWSNVEARNQIELNCLTELFCNVFMQQNNIILPIQDALLDPIFKLPLINVKCDHFPSQMHSIPFSRSSIIASHVNIMSNTLHLLISSSNLKAINSDQSDHFCCKWASVEICNCDAEENLFLIKIALSFKEGKPLLKSCISLPVDFLFTMKGYQLFESLDSTIFLTMMNQSSTKIFVYQLSHDCINCLCSFDTAYTLLNFPASSPRHRVVRFGSHILLNTTYKAKDHDDQSYILVVQHIMNLDNKFTLHGIPLIFTQLPQLAPRCELSAISFTNELKGILLMYRDYNHTTFCEITESFRCELTHLLEQLEQNPLSSTPSTSSLSLSLYSITLQSEGLRSRRRWLSQHLSRDSGYASLTNAYSECNVNFTSHRSQLQSYGSISSFAQATNFKSHPDLSFGQTQPRKMKLIQSNMFGCLGNRRQDFKEPNSLVVLPDQTLVVSDGNDQSIKFFTPVGGFISSWPTFAEPILASRGFPNCIALLPPRIDYSYLNFVEMIFDHSPKPNADWGLVVVLRKPTPCVQMYSLGGYRIREFGYSLTNPKAIAVDKHRRHIIIVESHVMRVTIFLWDGSTVLRFSCQQLGFPTSIACDKLGCLYISDNSRHCILKFDPQGRLLQSIGNQSVTPFPTGLCMGSFYRPSCNAYEEFLISVDNHISLNINMFTLDGALVASLQSVTRHNHLLAVAIDQVTNANSLVFSSKDCSIFRYVIPQSI